MSLVPPISLASFMPRRRAEPPLRGGNSAMRGNPLATTSQYEEVEPDLAENYANNPGNSVDTSRTIDSPAELSAMNQRNNPTDPVKSLPGEPVLNNMENSPGLAIFPNNQRPKTFEDVAREELNLQDPRYPKRGLGQVFADIGKGALRGISEGRGAISGAAAGGLGTYRQADRDAQVKARAGELQTAGEEVRKNVQAENTRENTQSMIDQRKSQASIAQEKLERQKNNDAFRQGIEKDKLSLYGRTVDVKEQRLAGIKAAQISKMLAEQGPYMDPEIRKAYEEDFKFYSGLEMDPNYAVNIQQTKMDLAPNKILTTGDGIYREDPYGRGAPEQILGPDGQPLTPIQMELARMRQAAGGLRRGGGSGAGRADRYITDKEKDVFGNTTNIRIAPVPRNFKSNEPFSIDLSRIKK